LQDHPAVTVGFNSAIRDGLSEIKPLGWLGLDIISPLALYKWAVRGGGVLCTTFCDHGAFVRSDGVGKSADGRGGRAKDAALPDLQLRFVPGIGPSPDGVKAYELLGKGVQHGHAGFTLQVIACRPRSTGTVRITCADPSVAPEIKCNYLASPEDSQTLARGIELARKLATSGALGEVSLDEVYPGAHVQSDAAVDAYIRETLHSANGLSGGCCLGHVVDEQLRVRGIRGLRVVDASVMPRIPGAQLALTLGVSGGGGGGGGAQNLTANVTALGCQLAVDSSAVGPVDATGLALLVDFVLQGVLLPLANAVLNAGLPLPSAEGLALTGAAVFYAQGYAGVCTIFTAA
jgi:hypothetical protein